MDRKGFLRSLGILAGASLIPDWAVAKKHNVIGNMPEEDHFKINLPDDYKDKDFVNHMSIQRFSHRIRFAGQAMTDEQADKFRAFL